jgi:hypothetical protein
VIENGTPNVVFMDAPRSRSMYVSSAWLEELKNGVVKSPKYKSKKVSLTHVPHAVVMMNDFPKKTPNDLGLSDDRYTYLVIDNDGENGNWFRGYDPTPQNAYDTIKTTIQTSLPNELQKLINKAFKSNGGSDIGSPQHSINLQKSFCKAVTTWLNNSKSQETNADKFVASINNRATERVMKEYVSSNPIEQYMS